MEKAAHYSNRPENMATGGQSVQSSNIGIRSIMPILISLLTVGLVAFYSNNLDMGNSQPQPDKIYHNYLLHRDL